MSRHSNDQRPRAESHSKMAVAQNHNGAHARTFKVISAHRFHLQQHVWRDLEHACKPNMLLPVTSAELMRSAAASDLQSRSALVIAGPANGRATCGDLTCLWTSGSCLLLLYCMEHYTVSSPLSHLIYYVTTYHSCPIYRKALC